MRENLPCLYGIKAGVAPVLRWIGAGCRTGAGMAAGLVPGWLQGCSVRGQMRTGKMTDSLRVRAGGHVVL